MAAYAATVTPETPKVHKIPGGLGVLFGTVDVTNYNQTLAEITAITKYFRPETLHVILGGNTDEGRLVHWDAAAKSVKAYTAYNAEAASDTDIGAVSFLAIGLVN